MSVRTRIAPSPTGFMHIGNLRTALYDIFLAKKLGGTFIIRIEDTDRERLVPGAIEGLLKTLIKLGLSHDEGPILEADGSLREKGAYGPYVQSDRLALYKEVAKELVAGGHAYPCFCSAETLEAMRTEQSAAKQTPKYDRRCLKLDSEEIQKRIEGGERHVIRLLVPEGTSEFIDAIRGKISFENRDVDDAVLIKSDGFPTYHLAVVVDDHHMKISHVLRGEEWISSTPKQIILHDALGWTMPIYAHVPLLLNADKTKLSKRKGDVAVENFLEKGYLPKALLNFVATLGYNPKADQEIYEMEELAQLFELERVNKSGAVVNLEKLDWFNRHYLKEMGEGEYLEAAKPFVTGHDAQDARVQRALLVEKLRIGRLDELSLAIEQYFATQQYEATLLVWKKSDAEGAQRQLNALQPFIENLPEDKWQSPQLLEEAVKGYISSQALSGGEVLWPLRVALSGCAQSPSPFEYLFVLQREESLERIAKAISLLKG